MAPTKRRDLAYLAFFLTHIPIMFAVDLYPLYPTSVVPQWMNGLRAWYITTYRDQNFINPSPSFKFYMLLELLYHVPVSFWAVGALWRGDPTVPIHLLIFAVEVVLSTSACLSEVASWKNVSQSDKIQLATLYGPYVILALLMALDMVLRLKNTILNAERIRGEKKKK